MAKVREPEFLFHEIQRRSHTTMTNTGCRVLPEDFLITELEAKLLAEHMVWVLGGLNHVTPDSVLLELKSGLHINGLKVIVVTHLLEPIKVGSQRKDWDFDMELESGVWIIRHQVVCQRCMRQYRGDCHDIGRCRKMFTDEQVEMMKVVRYP